MEYIQGKIKAIYRTKSDGYTKIKLIPFSYDFEMDSRGEATLCGIMPPFQKNTPIRAAIDECKNGIYYVSKVDKYSENKEAVLEFLTVNFPDITKKKAEKIYTCVGEPFFSRIAETGMVTKLELEVKLARALASRIVMVCTENNIIAELFSELHEYGVDYRQTEKLIKKHGPGVGKLIKAEPYAILSSVGISFHAQEEIAFSYQIPFDSKQRAIGILDELIRIEEARGNVFYCFKQRNSFERKVKRLCGKSSYEDVPDIFDFMLAMEEKKYILEQAEEEEKSFVIYHRYQYYTEKNLVFQLERLSNEEDLIDVSEKEIEKIEKKLNVSYSDDQKKAFLLLKKKGIKILTGGPGTGKTTVLNGLIQYFRKKFPNDRVLCCAPTGRAAMRMKEATGEHATTIHRLLKLTPFVKDRYNIEVDPIDAKLLIVDEVSMIGEWLFGVLLKACTSDTTILLVGDVDQLPSIEPGDVLHDLIDSGKFATASLYQNHRSDNGDTIITNAKYALYGYSNFTEDESFRIGIVDKENYMDAIQKYYHQNTYLLSPTNKGEMGVYECNLQLQKIYNPNYRENGGIHVAGYQFFKGDKVIFQRNNYQNHSYFNGEIGIIQEIYPDYMDIALDDRIIPLANKNYEDLALAYAMTIHKSQGSETEQIIILLDKEYIYTVTPKMLYTAITRAKKNVVLLILEEGLLESIATKQESVRNSRLKERIKKESFFLLS